MLVGIWESRERERIAESSVHGFRTNKLTGKDREYIFILTPTRSMVLQNRAEQLVNCPFAGVEQCCFDTLYVASVRDMGVCAVYTDVFSTVGCISRAEDCSQFTDFCDLILSCLTYQALYRPR